MASLLVQQSQTTVANTTGQPLTQQPQSQTVVCDGLSINGSLTVPNVSAVNVVASGTVSTPLLNAPDVVTAQVTLSDTSQQLYINAPTAGSQTTTVVLAANPTGTVPLATNTNAQIIYPSANGSGTPTIVVSPSVQSVPLFWVAGVDYGWIDNTVQGANVVVGCSRITANSYVRIACQGFNVGYTDNGGTHPTYSAIIPGTGFTMNTAANMVMYWEILYG